MRPVSVYEYSRKTPWEEYRKKLARLAGIAASKQALHLCRAVG
jgi:hypothetical protein